MIESDLSPRHARRRSMPAGFSSFQQKIPTQSQTPGQIAKDKLSVGSNWNEFENHMLAKRLLSSSVRQDELNWKRRMGLEGNSFWGFTSPDSEAAFFGCRLEAQRKQANYFMCGLFLLLCFQFLAHIDDMIFSRLSVVALWVTSLFWIMFSRRYVKKETSFVAFFLGLGVCVSLQNVAYFELFTQGQISATVFAADGKPAFTRKVMFLLLFYSLIGSSMVFGIRPAYMSFITFTFALVSHFPTFYYFWPFLSDLNRFEVFFTIVGPVYYMLIGMLLVGMLNNRSERMDFENMILKYDMECKVDQVRAASQSNLVGSSNDLGSAYGGSTSSLKAGSFESITMLAQESIMDKRMRAFQQIQKEYSVKRHPTMLVLIDICVGALALAVRQIQGTSTNWTEFFSSQQEGSQTSTGNRHGNGETRSALPKRDGTLVRRRRRHSVVTIDSLPGVGLVQRDFVEELLSPSSTGMRKRCSSTDQLPTLKPAVESNVSLLEPDLSVAADLNKHLRDWNFGPNSGIWSTIFSETTGKPLFTNPLTVITMRVLKLLGVLECEDLHLDETVVREYVQRLENAYVSRSKVPYHNALHACDVVQTLYATVSLDAIELPPLALLALILAAAAHDVAHPGLNNTHLVQTHHELALTYNDKSVLENFHVSRAFTIMSDGPEVDILAGLKTAKKNATISELRSLIIEMILSTDLKYHFDQQAKFRILVAEQQQRLQPARSAKSGAEDTDLEYSDRSLTDGVNNRGFSFSAQADVSLVCCTLLHTADISNVAKSWESYKPWMDCLFEEFFAQGDLERSLGLEVQPMMDRTQSNPANAQLYFITNLVLPLYQVLEVLIPVTCDRAENEMAKNIEKLRVLSNRPAALQLKGKTE